MQLAPSFTTQRADGTNADERIRVRIAHPTLAYFEVCSFDANRLSLPLTHYLSGIPCDTLRSNVYAKNRAGIDAQAIWLGASRGAAPEACMARSQSGCGGWPCLPSQSKIPIAFTARILRATPRFIADVRIPFCYAFDRRL